ncbi:MAG: hypothetical protein ACE5K4_06910 [Candidatus Hydrothermarchaeota archaeon]
MIGVITNKFSISYPILEEFRKRGIPVLHLSLRDEIPSSLRVVITTPSERKFVKHKNIVLVKKEKSWAEIVDEALTALEKHIEYSKLTIGIDPGEKPGVAVLGDNKVVSVYRLRDVRETIDVIRDAQEKFVAKDMVIKIGHEAPLHRNIILNSLINKGYNVEIVNESSSTPYLGRGTRYTSGMRDVIAAINIALSKGKKVKESMEVKPKKGDIKSIQEKSRIQSKGKITISREYAEKVAKGEISLKKAIEMFSKK